MVRAVQKVNLWTNLLSNSVSADLSVSNSILMSIRHLLPAAEVELKHRLSLIMSTMGPLQALIPDAILASSRRIASIVSSTSKGLSSDQRDAQMALQADTPRSALQRRSHDSGHYTAGQCQDLVWLNQKLA